MNHHRQKSCGQIDRVFVSMTEALDVQRYIAQFLERNGLIDSEANHRLVEQVLERYPGRAPYDREALDNYLNANIKVPACPQAS